MSHSRPGPRLALIALPLLLLTACSMFARPKPPGSQLTAAEDAVRDAERAHVGDYDAAGQHTMQRQLAISRALDADPKRQQLAGWIAAQTVADAELAEARARRARIFAYYEDLQHVAPSGPKPEPAMPALPEGTLPALPATLNPADEAPAPQSAPAGDATP